MSTFLYYLSISLLLSSLIGQLLAYTTDFEAEATCGFILILGIAIFIIMFFFDNSSVKFRNRLKDNSSFENVPLGIQKLLRRIYLLAFIGCMAIGPYFSYITISSPKLNFCVWITGPSLIVLGFAFLLKYFEAKKFS